MKLLGRSLPGDLLLGLGFHLGNAVKYILRAVHKGDMTTDLKKARWYLDRMIKRLEVEAPRNE